MTITYTKTEKLLLNYVDNMKYISSQAIEDIASQLDQGKTIWIVITLINSSNTDKQNYNMQYYYNKPLSTTHNVKEISLEILQNIEKEK